MDIAPIFTAQQNVAHFFDEKPTILRLHFVMPIGVVFNIFMTNVRSGKDKKVTAWGNLRHFIANKCDEWKEHKMYQSIDIHGIAFLYSHDPSASLGTNLCAFTCLYKPKKLTLHFGQVTMISALLCFTFIPFSP